MATPTPFFTAKRQRIPCLPTLTRYIYPHITPITLTFIFVGGRSSRRRSRATVCFSKLIHLFFLALFAYNWLLSSANVNDSSLCLCLFFVFMFMKYKCIRYETHKNNHNFISDYCILFKFYLMILQSLVIRHANLLKLDKKKFYFSYFN